MLLSLMLLLMTYALCCRTSPPNEAIRWLPLYSLLCPDTENAFTSPAP